MTLFVLAYLGGVLAIVSPCILPVLPFGFARSLLAIFGVTLLVRQAGPVVDHAFEFQVLDPAMRAYAFTFG